MRKLVAIAILLLLIPIALTHTASVQIVKAENTTTTTTECVIVDTSKLDKEFPMTIMIALGKIANYFLCHPTALALVVIAIVIYRLLKKE